MQFPNAYCRRYWVGGFLSLLAAMTTAGCAHRSPQVTALPIRSSVVLDSGAQLEIVSAEHRADGSMVSLEYVTPSLLGDCAVQREVDELWTRVLKEQAERMNAARARICPSQRRRTGASTCFEFRRQVDATWHRETFPCGQPERGQLVSIGAGKQLEVYRFERLEDHGKPAVLMAYVTTIELQRCRAVADEVQTVWNAYFRTKAEQAAARVAIIVASEDSQAGNVAMFRYEREPSGMWRSRTTSACSNK
jgi:hypothetical protein